VHVAVNGQMFRETIDDCYQHVPQHTAWKAMFQPLYTRGDSITIASYTCSGLITFNSNKSPTWCNNFSGYYPDVCLQLNMFRVFSRPARPRTQHGCHHDMKVKPEAATAVTELLMMGGKTPKTCWAVNRRQDNKLKNCCIRLVIFWLICKTPVPNG
jgi:hypothetical protein